MILPSEPDAMLTVGQARRVLGVSSWTLRELTKSGRLPDIRSLGGHRVFRRAARDAVLAERYAGSRPCRDVLLYARVSSRRQQREGDMERQLERLRDLAAHERREIGRASCRER